MEGVYVRPASKSISTFMTFLPLSWCLGTSPENMLHRRKEQNRAVNPSRPQTRQSRYAAACDLAYCFGFAVGPREIFVC